MGCGEDAVCDRYKRKQHGTWGGRWGICCTVMHGYLSTQRGGERSHNSPFGYQGVKMFDVSRWPSMIRISEVGQVTCHLVTLHVWQSARIIVCVIQ